MGEFDCFFSLLGGKRLELWDFKVDFVEVSGKI